MAVFNEDTRVKIPATIQFMRNGYEYQSLQDAVIHTETRICINRFKPALEKLNDREFTDQEVLSVIDEIHQVIKNNDLGKEFYNWLIAPNNRPKLIDFENIDNNDYSVIDELFFGPQEKGSFRPDINILINGIPLAFLEVKKPNNPQGIQAEFKRMINDRLNVYEFKKYFNMIQITAFSNNMPYEADDDSVSQDSIRAGSFYTTPNGQNTMFSFFREERKKVSGFTEVSADTIKYILKDNHYSPTEFDTPEFQTNLDPNTPCNAFVTSLFDKERLMYILHYGITYVDGQVPQKHIFRYPQFFASQAITKRLEKGGKSGIIFHTQGSGKTELASSCVRILTDYYAKKNVTARIYYVVDRIELLTQVSNEMRARGLTVTNVDNRKDFEKELNRPLAETSMDTHGQLTVVNIQKFSGNLPEAKNVYNANIQRIFFIDEAHRSYKMTGEFFKNLMLCDRDAIYLAMTGTPLLSQKERSNLKFGDYIHKYFYDKSIADGYTLRIKRENIDTKSRSEIRMNLELENPHADKDAIITSPAYIGSFCRYVEKDFRYFRLTNNDNSIGAMIVCGSNNQARKVKAWFDENSELETGLVISDEDIPSAQNRQTQLAFKNTLKPDLLIVNQMLCTGYDVPRLKKMYLHRAAKEHNLLQTISRVNRPYRSPNGKYYEFGYIVDFVDIQEEYDRTIEAYLKEIAKDFARDADDIEDNPFPGLVVSPEDIDRKYHALLSELATWGDISNIELFQQRLSHYDKDALYTIRRLLNGIKNCHTEFQLSYADDLAEQIDIAHIKNLIKATQARIDFVNLTTTPTDLLAIISNQEVCDIVYEFFRIQTVLLDKKLFEGLKEFSDTDQYREMEGLLDDLQKEVKRNKNRSQTEVVKLDEVLKALFAHLHIEDLDQVNGQLKLVLDQLRAINEENDRLAARYEGNYSFVKTFIDAMEIHPTLDKESVANVIDVVYDAVKGIQGSNLLVLQGRDVFINSVKKATTAQLLKSGLYKDLKLKDWYTDLLAETYNNMKMF